MARLSSVTVKYLGKTFIEGLICDFKESLCAVFGQSGSGKTTLCHVFSGLVQIEGGEVYIGEREVGDLPVKERNVSLISASTPLRYKTVRKNLLYPLKLRKKDGVEKILNGLGVEGIDKRISLLTDEERAEVYYARAMIKNPHLILVDEPRSILGEAGVRRLMQLLKGSNKNVIWFSSDFDEVRELDVHTKVIRNGKMVFEGSLMQLFDNPPDAYTAMLAGYNVIDGRAVSPNAFFKGDKKITVSVNLAEKTADGYLLYCHHDGLPLRIFSPVEVRGEIEVCYDENASVCLR